MADKLSSIKLRLGADLVNRIDNTLDKYERRGFNMGLSGSLIGGGLGYFLGGDSNSAFIGTSLGAYFGANLGQICGLTYGENKAQKENPELANDIQEYLMIKLAQEIGKK